MHGSPAHSLAHDCRQVQQLLHHLLPAPGAHQLPCHMSSSADPQFSPSVPGPEVSPPAAYRASLCENLVIITLDVFTWHWTVCACTYFYLFSLPSLPLLEGLSSQTDGCDPTAFKHTESTFKGNAFFKEFSLENKVQTPHQMLTAT